MKILLYPLQLFALVFGILNVLPSFEHPEHAAVVFCSFLAAYFLAGACRGLERKKGTDWLGFFLQASVALLTMFAGLWILLIFTGFAVEPLLNRLVIFGPGGLGLLTFSAIIIQVARTKSAHWFYINLPPVFRLEKIYCRCNCGCPCGMCDGHHQLEADPRSYRAVWFDLNFLNVFLVGPWCFVCVHTYRSQPN